MAGNMSPDYTPPMQTHLFEILLPVRSRINCSLRQVGECNMAPFLLSEGLQGCLPAGVSAQNYYDHSVEEEKAFAGMICLENLPWLPNSYQRS